MTAGRPAPHKKPVDVQTYLHWAIQIQKVFSIIGGGFGLEKSEAQAEGIEVNPYGSSDSVERFRLLKILGTFVDGGGASRGDVHPDAVEARTALQTLAGAKPNDMMLVWDYAKAGIAPDWIEGAPRFVPVINGYNRPKLIYDTRRHVIGCEVRIVNGSKAKEIARVVYGRWWSAINDIVKYFNDRPLVLMEYRITGPSIARLPWSHNAD